MHVISSYIYYIKASPPLQAWPLPYRNKPRIPNCVTGDGRRPKGRRKRRHVPLGLRGGRKGLLGWRRGPSVPWDDRGGRNRPGLGPSARRRLVLGQLVHEIYRFGAVRGVELQARRDKLDDLGRRLIILLDWAVVARGGGLSRAKLPHDDAERIDVHSGLVLRPLDLSPEK